MATRRPPTVHIEKRDAREALAALPVRSISVLITDPPYATVDRKPARAHLGRWFAKSLSWRAIGEVLAIARSRMRPDGIAFVMTNAAGLHDAIEALETAGFRRVRPITWDKRAPGLGGGLRHQTEFVLVGHLPASRSLAGVDLVSVAAVGPATAGRYPTEKPADLGRELAAMAAVGRADHVVDPFCGSGALLVGAAERGATVTGYDLATNAVTRATSRLVAGRTPAGPVRAAREPRRASAPAGAKPPKARGGIMTRKPGPR